MVDIFRYTEISESTHRILNPFDQEKVSLLAEICGLRHGMTQLDLACGKGEMLVQYAARHGSSGIGVDRHEPFLTEARARADELGVTNQVTFEVGDAGRPRPGERFDLVSCIGATWIGGGMEGTLELMKPMVNEGGWFLVGEPYWIDPPPEEARRRHEKRQDFLDLGDTLMRFGDAGLTLVEMVLATHEDWDRYEASQWLNVTTWLEANPESPEAPSVREDFLQSQREYLAWGRRYLGWGVFVLRSFR